MMSEKQPDIRNWSWQWNSFCSIYAVELQSYKAPKTHYIWGERKRLQRVKCVQENSWLQMIVCRIEGRVLDIWDVDTKKLVWKYFEKQASPLWEEEEIELSGNLWIGERERGEVWSGEKVSVFCFGFRFSTLYSGRRRQSLDRRERKERCEVFCLEFSVFWFLVSSFCFPNLHSGRRRRVNYKAISW